MKATLKIKTEDMNPQVRGMLNGILGGAPIEQVSEYLAKAVPEQIINLINAHISCDLSEACNDMLHDARLDGRWTVKQVAWYVRELRAE